MAKFFYLGDVQLIERFMHVLPVKALLTRDLPVLAVIHHVAVDIEIARTIRRKVHHDHPFKGEMVILAAIFVGQAALTGHRKARALVYPQQGPQDQQRIECDDAKKFFLLFHSLPLVKIQRLAGAGLAAELGTLRQDQAAFVAIEHGILNMDVKN